MLTSEIVNEAVVLIRDGFTQRDLHRYLFVSRDEFMSWFRHGLDLVEQGFGRMGSVLLEEEGLDDFDMLTLQLYKGIVNESKELRRAMHRLVADSENPKMAFDYLRAVYADIYDPKYSSESGDDEFESEDSATSFVMESIYEDEAENTGSDGRQHIATESET